LLNPFVIFEDAGFSVRRGRGVDRLAGWSPELIASLDWARLSELVQAIAAKGGYELAGLRVMPDGAVHFSA
jgi:hypothetical protein